MKTYAQWLAASVAVVAVSYATYSAWGDDTPVEAPAAGDQTKSMPLPSAVESTNLSDLRSEAPTPRAEFAAVRLSADSKTASSVRIQDPQPAPLAADPAAIIARREAERAEDEQRFKEYVGATAADFDREGRDPRWSSETGAALQAAFSSEDLQNVQYQNIDCRKTICRVEVVDDGSGAASEALHKVGTAVGSALPNMLVDRVDHGNGRATMILYLSSK
jgi:hypothetical protein